MFSFGTPPALYAAELNSIPLKPRLLVPAGEGWSFSDASIDPAANTVAYVRDTSETLLTRPGEIWVVPSKGGSTHKLASCKSSCRLGGFLADGRLLFTNYADGLMGGLVQVAKGTGGVSTLFGGDKSLAQCYVAVDVAPVGDSFIVAVSNELGWECKVDRVSWARAANMQLEPLPESIAGVCNPLLGEDGRIYVGTGGPNCAPTISLGFGEREPRPAPEVARGARQRSGWSVASVNGFLVANPPAGDSRRAMDLFEAEGLGYAVVQTRIRALR